MGLFFVGLFAVMALVVVGWGLFMRWSYAAQQKRFEDEPELARASPADGEPFVLRVPASGAFDVVLRMASEDWRPEGTGLGFRLVGVTVLLEGTRPVAGGAPAAIRLEALVGSEPRAQTDAAVVRAVLEDRVAFGKTASRSFVLARIPAGEAFELRGKLVASVNDRLESISILARPVA